MLNGPKVEVTAFQSVSLEPDQRLGPGFWSRTLQEAVFYVGQVVKIKNWTVCGQREEGGEVGESVSCCVSTRCCPPAAARKHFILFPGPRQRSHRDQSGSVTFFRSWSVLNSSQGHTGRFQQQKHRSSLCLLCASVVLFYIYHTRIWNILAEDVLLFLSFPNRLMNDLLLLLAAVVF